MPIVRRAGPDDAAAISALNRDVQAIHFAANPERYKRPGPDVFPPAEVEKLIAMPTIAIFIAEIAGEPAGYLYAELLRRAAVSHSHAFEIVHVHHISVRPQHRRQGIGRALMDAAVALARDDGIDRLGLDVWTFNADARGFFERYGLETY